MGTGNASLARLTTSHLGTLASNAERVALAVIRTGNMGIGGAPNAKHTTSHRDRNASNAERREAEEKTGRTGTGGALVAGTTSLRALNAFSAERRSVAAEVTSAGVGEIGAVLRVIRTTLLRERSASNAVKQKEKERKQKEKAGRKQKEQAGPTPSLHNYGRFPK